MQYSLIPSEREYMLDCFDTLERRARNRFTKKTVINYVLDQSGVELVLDALRLWQIDEVVVRAAVKVLIPIAGNSEGAEHILELGGRPIIEKVKEVHSADEETQTQTRKLLKVLTMKGAIVAAKEIKIATFCVVNKVDFTQACQLMLLAKKERDGGSVEAEASKESGASKISLFASDAASEAKPGDNDYRLAGIVIEHMKQHPTDFAVNQLGCEAFIELGRHADADAVARSHGLEMLIKAMIKFKEYFTIQWKACIAIAVCAEHAALSSELGKRGAIATLSTLYWQYADKDHEDRDLQQQVIWALNALVDNEVNIERMKKNEVFRILNDLINVRSDTKVVVPLRLRELWTPQELKEMSKEKKAPPKEKKRVTEWQLRPKPKFGKSTDTETGEAGLMDDD